MDAISRPSRFLLPKLAVSTTWSGNSQHLLLMAVDPGSEREQEQVGGVRDGSHPGILAVTKHLSGRHLRRGGLFGQDERP